MFGAWTVIKVFTCTSRSNVIFLIYRSTHIYEKPLLAVVFHLGASIKIKIKQSRGNIEIVRLSSTDIST
jgi:hypothetical protein